MKTKLFSLAIVLAAITTLRAAERDRGYTAHEWGTFTSVQGADGVQMEWNPLIVSELPPFVYELNRVRGNKAPGLLLAKTGLICRQRMETPVIYFYSDRERTLDVAVDFPQGTITEWYPLESAADLSLRRPGQKAKRPALQWKELRVLPQTTPAAALPSESSGSHYYAARETDASLVRVTTADKKSEVEKFLFYRGTGNFQAPLTVKLPGSDAARITLQNTGGEELRHLFIYEIGDNNGRWQVIDRLAAGATQSIVLDSSANDAPFSALADAVRKALVAEGLYEREAAAMVKTWEQSWFTEKGLRVLYTLPRAWTDRALPLNITPAPAAIARVMVGRAEIITPAMERALLTQVERYMAADEAQRPQIAAEARALGLGRFIEPTLRRLFIGAERSKEFSSLSWELLSAATFAKEKPVATAAGTF
jgi:hypothetical protein